MVRLLYARAVRVLLVEAEARALPVARGLLIGFASVLLSLEADDVETASTSPGTALDLVVIARDVWSDADTALCRSLHALRSAPPILALAGLCEPRHRAAALRAGADGFLVMPFDAEELAATAAALVRRASSRTRRARVGPFEVDFAGRRVFVDGRRIALTLREYDSISTLLERAGEVVTRAELAELMTATALGGESNVVGVHVSRIRDKLGPQGARIETVRGIGYRLRASRVGD